MAQPDYEIAPVLELTTPEQFKALGDPLRNKALELLAERAATTKELAGALGCPISTMAHHLGVLADAGLIRVVRTRQVRALTERYYGRVARTYLSVTHEPGAERTYQHQRLRQTLDEIMSPGERRFASSSFAYARLSREQAEEFAKRITQLADAFDECKTPGAPVYGFTALVYQTDWPELPEEPADGTSEAPRPAP